MSYGIIHLSIRSCRKILATLLLVVISKFVFAQERSSTVNVSHYVNPVLYLQGGVIAFVSDASGKASPKGKYLSVKAANKYPFNYNTGNSWKQLKPGQRVVVPLPAQNSAGKTRLQVKFRPEANINLTAKINTLNQMNKLTDALTDDQLATKASTKATGSEKLSAKKPGSVTNQTNKVAQKTPSTPARKTSELARASAAQPEKITTPECFFASETAYYTFYYLRIGDEVYYTDSFPVPYYANIAEAEDLQYRFFSCFLSNLSKQTNEEKIVTILNNPDFQIEDGLMHLRNPSISSSEILQTYPYTATYQRSQQERDNWIRFDQEEGKAVRFMKVGL